jgi:anti-sigma factor RsiW
MRCDTFIDVYSDFRDGIVTDETRAECEGHLAHCARCRRYDHAVEQGVSLYHELPAPSASHDFLPRLQHRIYHLEDASRLTPKRAVGSAALVAVAGVGLLAVTWLPFATRMSVEVRLPAVAVEAPAPEFAERAPLFDDGPRFNDAAFLTPFHPSLDGSSDLFTSYSLTVEGGWPQGQAVQTSGQLDSAR